MPFNKSHPGPHLSIYYKSGKNSCLGLVLNCYSMLVLLLKMTHFDLVEGTQTVVPGWYHVWEHTVQETDEPAESQDRSKKLRSKTIKTTRALILYF